MLIEPDSSEKETVRWQILFPNLDNAIDFCKILGYGQASESRLYKDDGVYYDGRTSRIQKTANKKAQRIVPPVNSVAWSKKMQFLKPI